MRVMKAVQSEIIPDNSWKTFSVRIMAFAGEGSQTVFGSFIRCMF